MTCVAALTATNTLALNASPLKLKVSSLTCLNNIILYYKKQKQNKNMKISFIIFDR